MTDDIASVQTGVDAPQTEVAEVTVESILNSGNKAAEEPAEQEPQEAEKPKELSPAEELDKLRKAKARDDRRIGKLTAQKYQAMKEAEELRGKLTPQQNQSSGELSPKNTGIPTKLNMQNYANYSDYMEARAEEIADYKFDKKFEAHTASQQKSQQSQQESAWEAERMNVVDKLGDDFAKEMPESVALLGENAETIRDFSPELKRAILKINNPTLALYNLAKDGMLEELADMSIEDARVELRLAERKEAAKPKTKAPTPLPASRGSVASGKPFDKYTAEEAHKLLSKRY